MQEISTRHPDSEIQQTLQQLKSIITLTATREIFIRLLPRGRMKKRGCFRMEERSSRKIKYKRLVKLLLNKDIGEPVDISEGVIKSENKNSMDI